MQKIHFKEWLDEVLVKKDDLDHNYTQIKNNQLRVKYEDASASNRVIIRQGLDLELSEETLAHFAELLLSKDCFLINDSVLAEKMQRYENSLEPIDCDASIPARYDYNGISTGNYVAA